MNNPGNAMREQVKAILAGCGVDPQTDYDALTSTQVDALLIKADAWRYRKPKNANGSRGRYFHAMLIRRLNRK